jgi:hypothetical protein
MKKVLREKITRFRRQCIILMRFAQSKRIALFHPTIA